MRKSDRLLVNWKKSRAALFRNRGFVAGRKRRGSLCKRLTCNRLPTILAVCLRCAVENCGLRNNGSASPTGS
jgi:hypothetical protein